MSSDDEDTAGDFMPTGGNKLGALFAMSSEDRNAAPTFKYQPPDRKKKKPAAASAAASAGDSADVYLETQMVKLFRDQQAVGMSMLCVRCRQSTTHPLLSLAFADQAKKKILEIALTPATYWMQTPYEGQRQFVSVQDEQGYMWTVQFKAPELATSFTHTVYALQYSLSVVDGSPEHKTIFELMGGDGEAVVDGDLVGVKAKYYALEPYVQSAQLQHPAAAPYKDTEEDVQKMRLGEAKVSASVDNCVRAMSKGQRRVAIVDNESGERVLAVLELAKVKKPQAAAPAPAPEPPAPEPPAPEPPAPAPAESTALVVVEETPKKPEPTPAAAPAEPAPAPAAAAPAAAPVLPVGAGGALDTNALLTTMLLNQLGGGAAAPKPAAPAASGSAENSEVLRGMDRLMVQMGQLYQKMDTLDMARKLDENNDKIENMFRRVMGKAPSAGYDPLRSGIDRESDHQTLLAEIEKRDKRIEELTDSYHNALSAISDHKEEASSLRVDLQIERDTALSRLKEAAERHRLQIVEQDAKARSEKDHAVAQARREGKEEGHKMGFAEGEREAFLKHAGGSMDELVDQLQQAREENVKLQQELLSMQSKIHDERKGHDEQIQLMNQLVAKYESRSPSPTAAAGAGAGGMSREEVSSMLSKSLKKIMNQVYFSIEESLEDGGVDAPVPPSQVLTTVTKAIKVCTKQAIANLKQELEAASPPPQHSPTDAPPAAAVHADAAAGFPSIPPPAAMAGGMPPPPGGVPLPAMPPPPAADALAMPPPPP